MSQKRKLEEYHDPDYPQNSPEKRLREENQPSEEKIARIREIIDTEFNREIKFKEDQLNEIDLKLARAKDILHQVRYKVVSEYYSQQHLQYNEAEIAAAQERTLFDDELDGKQIPLHPAIKKIVGKKPKTYDELLRVRPTVREAAKTAKTSIKEKSRTKKEEKRIQRMIKHRGIVIDHSKPENSSNFTTPAVSDVQDCSTAVKIPRHIDPIKVDKPVPKLNTARLNNQTKHLIVVGNTSKYIGDEKQSDSSSHKWMIYVQAKSAMPIEKFVTKVRFFLHESYRPNDIVDVDSPPFQLARRGWGEFPIRLQLYFDSRIQQKPVQLVHNLVLDKTLSGLQTMGAETLVEIWLRTDIISPPSEVPVLSPKFTSRSEMITNCNNNLLSPSKTAEIINPKAEIDENLFDFLDKIESPAVCADIEKIQPTLVDSPLVDNQTNRKTFISSQPQAIPESIKRLNDKLQQPPDTASTCASASIAENGIPHRENRETQPLINNTHPPIKQEISEPNTSPQNNCINDEQQQPPKVLNTNNPTAIGINQALMKPKILQKQLVRFIDKDGNVRLLQMLIAPKSSVPIKLAGQNQLNGNSSLKVVQMNGGILKPVQVVNKLSPKPIAVDSNANIRGNVPEIKVKSESELLPNRNPSNSVQPGTATPRTVEQNNSNPPILFRQQSGTTPKNHVIHKEGKVFIIDPVQAKLKQALKKQVSLLKPQISLLKPLATQDNSGSCVQNRAHSAGNRTSVASDHDYTTLSNPIRPTISITATTKPSTQTKPTPRQFNTITVRNCPNPAHFIPSKVPELKKGNFIPVKVNHKPVIALMKKQRREYRRELEQQFQSISFISIRSAIEFLLRRLPMVNCLALENDYRMSFPFIISSWPEFRKTNPIKLKALEWLRAKYIFTKVSQHPSLKSLELWTTKEIILFARHHAYTPVISSMEENQSIPKEGEVNVKTEKNDNLTDLVKSEIEKGQLYYQTITPNHRICDWVENTWQRVNGDYSTCDTVIDVDNLDDQEQDRRTKHVAMDSPLKNYQGKLWLSIDEKLENEASLVNGMCQEIGIRLQPEEIHRDVIHPTAQTVMAQTLRLFVQDVLRRSLGLKAKTTNSQSPSKVSVEPNDIRKALNSRPEFDVLTNKYFGTVKSKDLLELG